MPGYIAEFGGKYCVWTSIVDGPATYLMDEPDLIEYLRAEMYPVEMDMALHDSRMARVRQYGCSGGLYGPTKADLLAYNRAGPKETHVATEEEMVRLYTPRGPDDPPVIEPPPILAENELERARSKS